MAERKSAREKSKPRKGAEPIPFPDEIEHLTEVNCKISAALNKAETAVDRKDQEYMEEKRYMTEHRGEIDPHELFQNELALKQIDHYGALAVKIRDKITRLKDSPYFARVDFQEENQEVFKCYIGRSTFSHEDELLICDWRSPIASLFYDGQVGAAGYDAPIGRIEGQLIRKRQFKIQDGQLNYALESSINIQDDILQQELSHTADEKMKSIIATIQKEQNQIIRNIKAKTLIIQGVAGSGKTSIALHRIAFLLYRFKDKLTAQNVIILSPNKVFGDYIANVLPELGEEPINELSFIDIATVQLDGIIRFQSNEDPLKKEDEKWQERVRFKSTLHLVKRLDRYIEQMTKAVFKPVDYIFGRFVAKADFIQSRFAAYTQYPVKQRLQMIADDIHDRFESDNLMGDQVPTVKTILKNLSVMLKTTSTLVLYKNFYKKIGASHLFVMPEKNTLEWADVYPFLYLHQSFAGLQESNMMKHVVIDEMQDYTPIQYAVINKLFKCQKTILGDFGQLINPYHLHSLEDLRKIYQDAEFIELNKSYRSTFEIIQFAGQIQRNGRLEAVARHGEEPRVLKCKDAQEEILMIETIIDDFKESRYAALGIITKTNHEAGELYNILSSQYDVLLISPESSNFKNGVSITSVQMSKGLEFDEVIIPHVDHKNYVSKYDQSLLYIACTRAMHKLTLLYTGEKSSLLG